MSDLLPVGSVVRIKGKPDYQLMIIGYLQEVNHVIYDYISVIYPNGLTGPESCFVFQDSAVETVDFKGYVDTEGAAFTMTVPMILKVMKEDVKEN